MNFPSQCSYDTALTYRRGEDAAKSEPSPPATKANMHACAPRAELTDLQILDIFEMHAQSCATISQH